MVIIEFISRNSYYILVRKPSPGISQRIGNHPKMPNRSNATSSSTKKNNLGTMIDIDQQKENKFKQIFEQSTIDLSKKILLN